MKSSRNDVSMSAPRAAEVAAEYKTTTPTPSEPVQAITDAQRQHEYDTPRTEESKEENENTRLDANYLNMFHRAHCPERRQARRLSHTHTPLTQTHTHHDTRHTNTRHTTHDTHAHIYISRTTNGAIDVHGNVQRFVGLEGQPRHECRNERRVAGRAASHGLQDTGRRKEGEGTK